MFADHAPIELGEIVDLTHARAGIASDAIYVEASELHRIDDHRILRYDLTLPLLLDVRYTGTPLRLLAAGKAYRRGRVDATHLEAFHQAEVFSLDTRANLDPWRAMGRVLQSIEAVLPGRSVRITPNRYTMCSQAWELDVDCDGQWYEVMAWGVFTDRVVAAPRRRSGRAHGHRRRLRARAPGDAALRHRRHPQGRSRAGGVIGSP